jgi:copper homeostasis protein
MPRPLIEVAIATADDARAAHAGGADRLELSAALELGGLTPSLGMLGAVREAAAALPVVAMLRPRPGGFFYSAGEWAAVRRDADVLLANGAEAVAVGVLHPDRTINVPRLRSLVSQFGPRRCIFHRAFDVTPDPLAALDVLIDLGIARVLTSGQRQTAVEGRELIRRLVHHSAGRIEILPGSGVGPDNAAALLSYTGAGQVHGSFSVARSDPAGVVCDDCYRGTDRMRVGATRTAVDAAEA